MYDLRHKSLNLSDLHAPPGPLFGRIEEVDAYLVPTSSSHVEPKPLCQPGSALDLTPHLLNPLPHVFHVCTQASPPGEALPSPHIYTAISGISECLINREEEATLHQ